MKHFKNIEPGTWFTLPEKHKLSRGLTFIKIHPIRFECCLSNDHYVAIDTNGDSYQNDEIGPTVMVEVIYE